MLLNDMELELRECAAWKKLNSFPLDLVFKKVCKPSIGDSLFLNGENFY